MKDFNHKGIFPQHVYVRGRNGGIVFYYLYDCIYYITLYTCLAEKHGITTAAFSLMPNHTHSQQYAERYASFTAFNQELLSRFTLAYNAWHKRSGELFDTPFGHAAKITGKLIKSNLSYICNNGAEGRLSEGVLDYRWNLMAYRFGRSPFSQPFRKDRISKRLRDAMKMVDYLRDARRPIGYNTLAMLFSRLRKSEKKQLTDYILSKYNPLDYSGIEAAFGSFDRAIEGMEANCGSEYDIKEDWDDYSVYSQLGCMCVKKGIDISKVNFENMGISELSDLRFYMKRFSKATDRQLEKFLHISAEAQSSEQ